MDAVGWLFRRSLAAREQVSRRRVRRDTEGRTVGETHTAAVRGKTPAPFLLLLLFSFRL